jgi:hypothetical protein
MTLRTPVMFTRVISHLIGLQAGVVGLLSRRGYHKAYGDFPCCLVGGRFDSVEAAAIFMLCTVFSPVLGPIQEHRSLFHRG